VVSHDAGYCRFNRSGLLDDYLLLDDDYLALLARGVVIGGRDALGYA
jgi:hypothetical protein